MFDDGPEAVRYSWVAVRGLAAAELLAASGLEAVGACEDVPDLGLAELPDGWVAIVDADPGAAFRPPLSDLSMRGSAVMLSEDVRAQRTEARRYEDGRETWQVLVDPAAPDVLSFRGKTPDEYDPLVDSMGWEVLSETPPEEVAAAYFEIPRLLASFACGLQVGAEPERVRWMQLRRRGD